MCVCVCYLKMYVCVHIAHEDLHVFVRAGLYNIKKYKCVCMYVRSCYACKQLHVIYVILQLNMYYCFL